MHVLKPVCCFSIFLSSRSKQQTLWAALISQRRKLRRSWPSWATETFPNTSCRNSSKVPLSNTRHISNLLGFLSVCVVILYFLLFLPTADLDELILHGELRHLASPPQSTSTKPLKPAATQPSPPAFIKEKGFRYYLSVDRCAYIV